MRSKRNESILFGAGIGFCVASIATAILGFLVADNWLDVLAFFIIFGIGLTLTGAVVGLTRDSPKMTGIETAVSGLLPLYFLIWQLIGFQITRVGTFLGIYIVLMSGVICGAVIGALVQALLGVRSKISADHQHG